MTACPCCSGKKYADCCGLFIDDAKLPATPEQLMRSRYTAYTQANVAYIARTMKSPAIDEFEEDDARAWALSVKWIKLEVLDSGVREDQGFVEFIAHFSQHGKRQSLHEASEFQRLDGEWYYLDGKQPAAKARIPASAIQIGRNDPCHCGSGKKFKKCCG